MLNATFDPADLTVFCRLEELGLVELSPAAPILRLVEIELHFPPPSKRSDRTGAERQRRKRAHDRGDHTLCLPKHCPSAIGHAVTERDGVTGGATGAERAVGRDMSRVTVKGPETAENRDSSVAEPESVTALVTRDPGTGRDGTATTTQPSLELGGRDVENEADPTTGEVADWPTRVPGEPDAWQESEPGRWEPVTKGAA